MTTAISCVDRTTIPFSLCFSENQNKISSSPPKTKLDAITMALTMMSTIDDNDVDERVAVR